jgi:hypothetical protein
MLRATAFLALTSILMLTAAGRASADLYSVSIHAGGGELTFDNFDQSMSGPALPAGGVAKVVNDGALTGPASTVHALASVGIVDQLVGFGVVPTVHLGVDAGATFSDATDNVDAIGASANVSYNDRLTISVLGIDPTGKLKISLLGMIEVEGAIKGWSTLNAQYGTTSYSLTGTAEDEHIFKTLTVPLDENLTTSLLSISTVPLDLGVNAIANANASNPDSYAGFAGSITLLGLELVDQNGNYIPATFTSGQGFNYLDVGSLAVVPEPSTAVVAVFGAVAFVVYGRSRHRREQRRQAAV